MSITASPAHYPGGKARGLRARALLALAVFAHSLVGVEDGAARPQQLRPVRASARGSDSGGSAAQQRSCERPSAADVAAAIASSSADDAAALRLYGAGGVAAADTGALAPLGAGEPLCFVLLVQQPASLAVHLHRPLDLPGVLPDAWYEEPYEQGHVVVTNYPRPAGTPPDDVLLRLHAGDAAEVSGGSSLDGSDTLVLVTAREGVEGGGGAPRTPGAWRTASVGAASLAAARATWHVPPRFTAYAGSVAAAAVARLLGAAAASGGGAPPRAAQAAALEHAAYTWASGPPRTAYACSAGQNGGCSLPAVFDDVGAFTGAHLPLYAPLELPLAPFLAALPPAGLGGGAAAPPPCPAAATLPGFWSQHGAPGAVLHATNGRSWHASGCALRSFTAAATAACLARVAPRVAFIGDSHIRRHFKDLHGRGSDAVRAWTLATPATGAPLTPAAAAILQAYARAVAGDATSARSSWCGGGVGGARYGDVDCACSDVAYGPIETVPNPLEILYGSCTETRFGDGAARATLDWMAGFTEPEGLYDLSQATLARATDAAATAVVFDLVHWDAAFGSLPRFEHALPGFVEYLHAEFPPPALLVFRTPTYYAGDDVAAAERYRGRRYMSHGKVAWMHVLALRALRAHAGVAARLRVWDVHALGAERQLSATVAQQLACTNGHERAEDIDVQAHVLLNLLCGGAGDGGPASPAA